MLFWTNMRWTGGVQKVKELHLEDMDVIVEPGIGWIELNEYLKPHGLFFPLDPGNTSLLCYQQSFWAASEGECLRRGGVFKWN